MKKTAGYTLVSVLALFAAACSSNSAVIEAEVKDAPNSELVLKRLELNKETVLDTLKSDASGKVSYKYAFTDENPEFIYLYYGDRRLGSLIIAPGDRIKMVTDTLGCFGHDYSVAGSEESMKLAEYEKKHSEMISNFNAMAAEYSEALSKGDTKKAEELQYKLGGAYVKAKQGAIKHIFTNIKSFSTIPVIYGSINENLPLFADVKDGLIFKRLYDSLSVEYPTSRYVVSLLSEYERRQNLMTLSDRFSTVEAKSFPDIVLPDMNAEYKSLASLEGKPIILYFWTMTDVNQKMFNQELKKMYEKYKSSGLQIYQVCLDMDKTAWANTVRVQELPWINVCDGLGSASPAASSYNLRKIPSIFYISKDGEIVARDKFDNIESIVKKLI